MSQCAPGRDLGTNPGGLLPSTNQPFLSSRRCAPAPSGAQLDLQQNPEFFPIPTPKTPLVARTPPLQRNTPPLCMRHAHPDNHPVSRAPRPCLHSSGTGNLPVCRVPATSDGTPSDQQERKRPVPKGSKRCRKGRKRDPK